MEIYISIDGVLRNRVQKMVFHYTNDYVLSEPSEEDNFEYSLVEPIKNDDLLSSFKFQSKEQYDYFLYIEYVLEIFGHAGLSHENCFTELNKFILENSGNTVTIVGLNELGRAKPATLFFLSKNGFMGNNIKFIKSSDIDKEWEKCDIWITDEKEIIDKCPNNKKVYKFNTIYNQHFTNKEEISKLIEIK